MIFRVTSPRTYFPRPILTGFLHNAAAFTSFKRLKTLGLWFWHGLGLP